MENSIGYVKVKVFCIAALSGLQAIFAANVDLNGERTKPLALSTASLHPIFRDAGWRALQQAQVAAADALTNVVAVKSADVCESANIHPRDKSALARRLSRTWDKMKAKGKQ